MGNERSGNWQRDDALSAMQLERDRVSADDAKGDYARGRDATLHAPDFAEGILLPGLSLHLEQRGRAHHRPALAPVLPRSGKGDLTNRSERNSRTQCRMKQRPTFDVF